MYMHHKLFLLKYNYAFIDTMITIAYDHDSMFMKLQNLKVYCDRLTSTMLNASWQNEQNIHCNLRMDLFWNMITL